MKNIVFIPNINLNNGRNNPYHYSILSWKKWAKQYDNIDTEGFNVMNLLFK